MDGWLARIRPEPRATYDGLAVSGVDRYVREQSAKARGLYDDPSVFVGIYKVKPMSRRGVPLTQGDLRYHTQCRSKGM